MTDLSELEALVGRATPGPWMVQDGCSWRRIGTHRHDGDVLRPANQRDGHPDFAADNGKMNANLTLIVAAVNALPHLISTIRSHEAALVELRAENEKLTKINRDFCNEWNDMVVALARPLARAARMKIAARRSWRRGAEMATNLAVSCPICFGNGTWGEQAYTCHCQQVPEPAVVRFVLERLTPKQMAFLRFGVHTLANQTVSEAEWNAIGALVEFFVEEDDATLDGWDIIIPATQRWFAGASMHSYAGVCTYHIKYNQLGLALRLCLMCGADANVGWAADEPVAIVAEDAEAWRNRRKAALAEGGGNG